MTDKQLNRNIIKDKFNKYNLSDELIEEIRLFGSERYVDGLRQKEFDLNMDLIIENEQLKKELQEYKDREEQIKKFYHDVYDLEYLSGRVVLRTIITIITEKESD